MVANANRTKTRNNATDNAAAQRHAIGRSFQPLIDHGRIQDKHALGKTVELTTAHALWLVESGLVTIETIERQKVGDETKQREGKRREGKKRRIEGPAVFITAPGTIIKLPQQYVSLYCLCRWHRPIIARRTHTVPPEHTAERNAFVPLVRYLWLSDHDLLRCNAQLNLLLLDLMRPADDNRENEEPDLQKTEDRNWLDEVQAVIKRDLAQPSRHHRRSRDGVKPVATLSPTCAFR